MPHIFQGSISVDVYRGCKGLNISIRITLFMKCNICNQEKPIENFTLDRTNHSTGRQRRCKECDNKRRAEWRKNHPTQNKEACSRYYNKKKAENSLRMKSHKIPLAKECFFCDSHVNLERAHYNYEKPENFVTMCRSCHRKFDALTSRN